MFYGSGRVVGRHRKPRASRSKDLKVQLDNVVASLALQKIAKWRAIRNTKETGHLGLQSRGEVYEESH